MDLASIIGLVLGIGCILFGIFEDIGAFLHIPSLVIVLGGGISSTMISYRLDEITKVMGVVTNAFMSKEESAFKTIQLLVDMSQKARREGLLALESGQEAIEDEYLKKSLELVVDGVEPEIIKDAMALELANLEARHKKGQGLFKTMGAMFPAWGMIGTLMGLINLLKALDDPSAIGPAMAVALITTFYGSVFANWVCLPIAEKLGMKSAEEIRMKEMMIEGVLSIQSGENPRIMEHRLKTFLSPNQKLEYEKLAGGSNGGGEE